MYNARIKAGTEGFDEDTAYSALSLSEYVESGGVFDDGGNGGERVDPREFVAALHPLDGTSITDILSALSITEYWIDSTLPETALIRDWGTLPLEARMHDPLTREELLAVHEVWWGIDRVRAEERAEDVR